MTLAASRIVVQGETPYAHERAAIDFAISVLPSHDPYHLWALTELLDPSSGRLHEIDLLVLGYSTLFLIEAKSGPGLYTGDSQDWYRTAPGEARPRYLENPNRLTNLKAKILASRLRAKMTDPKLMPFVQPLVFLSAPVSELQLRFNNYGDLGVVTRDTFFDAMKLGRFPGSDGRQRPRINEPTMRQVAAAMAAIGLKPRRGKAHVGAYELAGVLGEGPGFQDRLARHRDNPAIARRARIYAVPQASSVERRQQLRRAADRDAQLLFELREHPSILRFVDYVVDAELGPTVLFDQLDGAMPLDAFLRHDNPGFYDRVTLVEHIARALAHCHKKGIIHGALSPEAVLVRRQPAVSGASGAPGALDVRVFNFQLGFGPEVEATTHWSALGSEPWAVYQAPELREDANNRRPVSDMFSLGALAYLIFTGRAPGATAADVDQHLARHRTLDPRAVDDSIDEKVGDLVANITDRSPINRIDDPDEWIELLLSEVTRPTDQAPGDDLSPLDAKPGDALGDELLVVEVGKDRPILGQGATSRVLLVARVSDGRSYALKVSLSAEHDERLEDEARELERLRHPRIVQLVQRYSFAGRPSLLLSLAGVDTLHRLLAREGTVSLERAARYGEDLLSAVDYLEEHKILHRDIKPANVGVGSVSNKAHHLTLFDFSLASAPLTELQVGTAAYRDPFLRQRGVWDAAAERWSTAVTLHEMVTGIRPSFDRPVVDPDAALVIAVERIDPSVRANLAAFFERSLHKDAGLRFESADAMRRAWLRAFESPAIAGQVATEREPQVATTADLAALGPETPMEALPLSPRARNALDRAGFLTAGDLHGLADNRLSAIRGIGSNVAKEIHEFKDRWAKAHADAARPAPFFPSYRGEDTAIAATALGAPGALGAIDARAQAALLDAGLTTLAAVAESPAPQIRALAHRFGFDERALNELLGRENTSANERARPSTIAGWVEALLPKKKSLAHIRELYGLDGPLAGQLGIQVRALADAIGMTTAGIYLALGKARETWSKHGALPELQSLAHTIVAQAGGVSPLDGAGRALLGVIHHGFTGSGAKGTDSSDSSAGSAEKAGEARDDAALVAATSLLRVVAEVEKDEDGGLRTLRVDDRGLWLCASEAHGRALRVLGDAADALAARPIVPGQSEAQRAFAEAVADTPLAALPLERLADIAAAASATAARSARLEIYPRGMEPERALTLSASQLRSNLEPAEIVRRVSLRYPAAQPLPDRPALDALLAVHGLVFDAPRGQYVRAGENEPTIMSSRLPTLTERFTTALPSQSLSMDPEAVQAREFDALLRNAAERRELRVLGVRPDRARSAALALASRLGTQPIAFDQRLVAAIRVEMERAGIAQDEVVHAADRAGRTGSAWRNLVKLATLAGNALMDELLITNQVLLLTQLGLIGRYRLDGLVEKLLAGRRPAPVFMLVPSHDTGAIPTIQSPGGDYPIPGLLRSQVLWVPLEWLDNHHNRPAEPGLAQKAG